MTDSQPDTLSSAILAYLDNPATGQARIAEAQLANTIRSWALDKIPADVPERESIAAEIGNQIGAGIGWYVRAAVLHRTAELTRTALSRAGVDPATVDWTEDEQHLMTHPGSSSTYVNYGGGFITEAELLIGAELSGCTETEDTTIYRTVYVIMGRYPERPASAVPIPFGTVTDVETDQESGLRRHREYRVADGDPCRSEGQRAAFDQAVSAYKAVTDAEMSNVSMSVSMRELIP